MKDFLDDYITSLTSKQRANIFDILGAARVGKEELDTLAKKLADTKRQAPLVISPEKFGGFIAAANLDAMERDVSTKLKDLFAVSNNISLILDSHTSLLTSEIKALEDELTAIEKTLQNFAFTLSDNGFYDYAFTETFNDATMLDDSMTIPLTDRSGTDFTNLEIASVNSSSGTLTLSPSLQTMYHLTPVVVDSNCISLATSDTGIANATNLNVGNGWRIAISSPRPITSSIPGATKQGAQVAAEFTLDAASPCDTIILTPFADIPVDLLEVKLYTSLTDNSPISILPDVQVVDRPINISFPLQNVAKVRLILNQSIYNRGSQTPNKSQTVYRDFNNGIRFEQEKTNEILHKPYNRNSKVWKRVFISTQKFDLDVNIFRAEIPQSKIEATRGPLTIDKLLSRTSTMRTDKDIWEYQSKPVGLLKKMIDEKLFGSNSALMGDRHVFNTGSTNLKSYSALLASMVSGVSQEYPRINNQQAPINVDILSYAKIGEEDYLKYQYNLGLRNIQVGTGMRLYRGVFITKPIPAPSDSAEIKIKTDDINFALAETTRDSGLITSIEYSVSNKSKPASEADWIPIMPIDTTLVEGERLFVNEAGYAILRFAADVSKELAIYKNGYKISIDDIALATSPDGASIKSLRIPMDTFLATDIFTVDYTPYNNEAIINFAKKGFDQTMVASAYDDSGAGETFSGTGGGQIILLNHDPYISYELINQGSTYSSTYGLMGYQPITIVMADGTTALNQTNYVGLSQNNLSTYDGSTYAYLHSGKNIIFNKPIDTSFTVYYQYLPSNLRLRVILRVNDINYVTPVVNSVQLKTKTLKADPRKIF